MQNFFLGIVEITLGMSLLILLMLLVLRVIGGKFTAKCRYILWTLVLIRLAVPFGFGILPALIEVPVEPVTAVWTEVQSTITVPTHEYVPPQTPQGTAVQQQPIQTSVPTPVPEVPEPAEHQPEVVWEQFLYLLSAAYLTGAALFLFWNLLSYAVYTGKILHAGREPDEHTMGIYTAVCRANQLRHIPHLIISPHVNSPAAFSIIRRRIVLPDIGLGDNALAGTLMHEVTHCKRGDLYIKAAALFARSLHWFNPLVHLAAFRCEMEMELSCDESVLAGRSDETRAAYGESMLDIIRRCRRNRGSLTTHFNPKKTAVKARLQNILYGSGKRRGTVLIVLCLVLCLIAGTIVALRVEADHTEQTEKREEHTEEDSEEKVLTLYKGENTESRLDEPELLTEAVSPAKVLEYQLAGLGVTSDQYLYRTLLAIVTSDSDALERVMGLPAGSGQIFTDISVTSCSVSRPENTGYFNPILLTLDIAESNSSVFPVGQSQWIVDEGYQGITLNNYSDANRIAEPEQLTDAESAVWRWLDLAGQVIHPLNRDMTEEERSEFQRGATEYACRHADGTPDSIREMVKLCFGSEEYFNKKVLGSDDGIHYEISGRGGARRSFDWIGETENADGSTSVRILFYADVSKYIMAKTVEYTLRPVGEDLYGQTIWSFESCTVLEDHGYPPFFRWA